MRARASAQRSAYNHIISSYNYLTPSIHLSPVSFSVPIYQTSALHPQCHLLFNRSIPHFAFRSDPRRRRLQVSRLHRGALAAAATFPRPFESSAPHTHKRFFVGQHARPSHVVMDRMQTHMRSSYLPRSVQAKVISRSRALWTTSGGWLFLAARSRSKSQFALRYLWSCRFGSVTKDIYARHFLHISDSAFYLTLLRV